MIPDPFRPFLDAQGFVVVDGGLATALEAAGHVLDSALWSARLLLDAPEAVSAVHAAYLRAGADCITTAGYQASLESLREAGLDAREAEGVLRRAVTLAVEARDAYWAEPENRSGRLRPIVAASAGPYGAYLADGSEYRGRYGVGREALEGFHRARLEVLADAPADIVAFETVPSGVEVEAIAAVMAERGDAPGWISFSCRNQATLRDGTPVLDAVRTCESTDSFVAVGVNCTAPRHVPGLIERIVGGTDKDVIVYPNSGEGYDPVQGRWTGAPDAWIRSAPDWLKAGARVIGGCCRVGPDDIVELRAQLEKAVGRRTGGS